MYYKNIFNTRVRREARSNTSVAFPISARIVCVFILPDVNESLMKWHINGEPNLQWDVSSLCWVWDELTSMLSVLIFLNAWLSYQFIRRDPAVMLVTIITVLHALSRNIIKNNNELDNLINWLLSGVVIDRIISR